MAILPPSTAHTSGAVLTSFAQLRQKLMPGWGVINGGYEESPLRLKCGLRGRRDVGFSHINMCLSGPSSPSGGGPQHQMEPSLACVSPASTCHEAAPHFPLSSAVIYLPLWHHIAFTFHHFIDSNLFYMLKTTFFLKKRYHWKEQEWVEKIRQMCLCTCAVH